MKSIKAQLVASYTAMLVVILVSVGIICINVANNYMENLATETLKTKLNGDVNVLRTSVEKTYGQLVFKDKELKKENGQSIRDDYVLVDKISKDLGDVVTIFQTKGDDFERITTNIVDSGGKRAVGTMLGKDSAAYSSIKAKKRFIGHADILNARYLTVYDPIVIDNAIVGILFVGVSTNNVDKMIEVSILQFKRTFYLIIAVALIVAVGITAFIGIKLSKPLVALKEVSVALGKGNLTTAIDQRLLNNKTEIGHLSESFEQMRLSLKELIGDIQRISKDMLSSSDALSLISKNTSEASSEVAKNVNEIAQGAMDQAENTESGTQAVASLGELIDENSQILEHTRVIVGDFSRLF